MTMTKWDRNDGISLKARREQNANHDAIDAQFALLNKTMTVGTGFAGTGTVYKTAVYKVGDLIKTEIFIDLTGAKSSTTDLDIIGNHATNPSHIGQITAAKNGTIIGGRMTCLELPTTGADDIDLYCATEGTGAFDGGIASLAETALVTAGGAWASGTVKGLIANPGADKYLYLCAGEGSVAGTYGAGQFLIELWGI